MLLEIINESYNALFKLRHMKIDQKSDLNIAELQIGQQLSSMNIRYGADCFQFNN